MPRELTEAFLRTLRPPVRGRLEIRDARLTRLVFRLTPTGAASWSLRTVTRAGRQTRVTLGTWPAIRLARARKIALETLAAIQQGADPVGERRAARATCTPASPTVSDRLAAWQAVNASRWSVRYANEVARLAAREIVPALGARPLAEVRRGEWVELVARKRILGAPGAAALLLRVISSFLGHAEAAGWIEASPLPRRARRLIAPPVPARERVLSDVELATVWRASASLAPKQRASVRLLILTGARTSEIGGATAAEIDRDAGVWRLPAARAKNRRSIALPLGPLAMAELEEVWPPEPVAPGRYLFGSGDGAGPFAGWQRLKARLDALAPDLAHWRLHDLRRTVRTGLTRLGIPREVAELALNHVSHQTPLERVYDRADRSEDVLAALAQWQSHVAKIVSAGGLELATSSGRQPPRRVG